MISHTALASTAILVLLHVPPAVAAPTLDGLEVITEGDTLVYHDTEAANVLWVTPPTTGSLRLLNQEAFFVDKKTCQNAATVSSRKANYIATIVDLEDRYFELLLSKDVTDIENKKDELWSTIEELKTAEASISYSPEMAEVGGVYSYEAASHFLDAIDSVRAKNASMTVMPITTSVTSISPSLANESGTVEIDGLFLDVGIPNSNDLVSAVDKIQIDVTVSKLAACFLNYPDVMSSSSEPFKFGFVVNYEYPFLFKQRVTAEYNLLRVYQRIEQTKKKKRFFSSKTYASVIESTELQSDLVIKIVSEQPLGPEVLLQLERQARELVLNVAITEMVAKMKEAGVPGPTGAEIAASELSSMCGPNVYCQGAAAGLRILDGMFGGSSQSSSIKQTLDHNVSYDSQVGVALPVARTISYVSN
jgi:hypothetical protein